MNKLVLNITQEIIEKFRTNNWDALNAQEVYFDAIECMKQLKETIEELFEENKQLNDEVSDLTDRVNTLFENSNFGDY